MCSPPQVLIKTNIFVECSWVLSSIVGIIRYCEGLKKHLANPVYNNDFLLLDCLGNMFFSIKYCLVSPQKVSSKTQGTKVWILSKEDYTNMNRWIDKQINGQTERQIHS